MSARRSSARAPEARPRAAHRQAVGVVAVAGIVALAGCRPSPRDQFEREVVPVLEQRCSSSACHGVGPGAEDDGEVVDRSTFVFDVDGQDRIVDVDQAYDAAKRVITTQDDPSFSQLLRKPLPFAYGGLPHYGGEGFDGPEDDAYVAVRDWIARESGGGQDVAPLDDLETEFRDDVLPVLVGAGCMAGACHGTETAIPFRFDPGVGGEFSVAAVRQDHDVAVTMLSLDGDAASSRLVRKGLPLGDGGMAHKGGNGFFLGTDDERLGPVYAWICAERLARTGEPCADDGQPPISGFVYVRGPLAPEDPFDPDVFSPGTDVWLATVTDDSLVPTDVRPMTSSLHDGPADVRDPAVDPTGTKLAFAMRTSADEGHAIWVMDLATGAAKQVTDPGGALPGGGFATDRDPTWGPEGHLWFSSTRAGVTADRADRLDADLYEVDPDTGDVTRWTHTPLVERKPVFYASGTEGGGKLAFTALRDTDPAQARAHAFRFPLDLKTEYHQHFGITPPETLTWDTRELADGRYVAVLGDLADVWGGRLAVIDRNFGPEVPAGDVPGVPFYAPPIVRLDDDATSSGVTGRLYRDPVGLPDDRILAAVAEGPLDLADRAATVDTGIVALQLRERPDASGPEIASRTVLVDEPGVAEWDPEPIFVRWPGTATLPPATTGATATVHHQGLPMIDALISDLPPTGPRPIRDDMVAVRILEAVPSTPDARAGTSLGWPSPARVLAELPLAADGSFQAELPADASVRFQGLDARGMATGHMHDRWFDLHPGQILNQGVSPRIYPTLCAACHGALDGDPDHVFVEPDLVTTASLTLSRYDGQDPRRPIPSPDCTVPAGLDVGFERDVQPIVERRCASCHAGKQPAAGLDLEDLPAPPFNRAYRSLLAPGDGPGGYAYVDAYTGQARTSPLVDRLLAGHGGVTDDELRVIARWIDTGAAFRLPEDE